MLVVTLPPEPKVGSRSPGLAAAATTASTKKVASAVSLRIRFAACLTSANTRTTTRVGDPLTKSLLTV
jgi:hypothetical protein